eukprot:Gb_15304 [translate_table: standard]
MIDMLMGYLRHPREWGLNFNIWPPVGEERVSELGAWERREFKVSGNNWDFNSMDVAAAGLGWFSIALKGEATLAVWCYAGVDITLRSALILDRARSLYLKHSGTICSLVYKKLACTLKLSTLLSISDDPTVWEYCKQQATLSKNALLIFSMAWQLASMMCGRDRLTCSWPIADYRLLREKY